MALRSFEIELDNQTAIFPTPVTKPGLVYSDATDLKKIFIREDTNMETTIFNNDDLLDNMGFIVIDGALYEVEDIYNATMLRIKTDLPSAISSASAVEWAVPENGRIQQYTVANTSTSANITINGVVLEAGRSIERKDFNASNYQPFIIVATGATALITYDI